MLTDETLERILLGIPRLTLGVVGDLFLDRYLDVDAALTEPSLETGLDAYQVVRVRPCPGAAGTVINNLVALGVGRICPISVLGDDGEGYELRQALEKLQVVEGDWLLNAAGRRTPTYTKPLLHQLGQPPRELNRLDIKNRTPLPEQVQAYVLKALDVVWPVVDALIVLDQVSEADCGVMTARVRDRLAALGRADPGKFVLADSRERIGLFCSVCLKPNLAECCKAIGRPDDPSCVSDLARRADRAVFCTAGQRGILLADPGAGQARSLLVLAYPVAGPIDTVGAGDSTSAGITCAVAAGVSLEEAASFGNLVASITIQQIGTTGTATPDQVRARWRECRHRAE